MVLVDSHTRFRSELQLSLCPSLPQILNDSTCLKDIFHRHFSIYSGLKNVHKWKQKTQTVSPPILGLRLRRLCGPLLSTKPGDSSQVFRLSSHLPFSTLFTLKPKNFWENSDEPQNSGQLFPPSHHIKAPGQQGAQQPSKPFCSSVLWRAEPGTLS